MSYWKKGYKEVKNVIHNDIGMTKDDIREIFENIAKEEIKKIISSESDFIKKTMQEVIKDAMVYAVQEHRYPNVTGNFWVYGKDSGESSFKDFISVVMKDEIINQLRKEFDINVLINKNN